MNTRGIITVIRTDDDSCLVVGVGDKTAREVIDLLQQAIAQIADLEIRAMYPQGAN